MRRRIHLHGLFASYHDGPITVFASTVAEAIERVTSQIKAFAPNAIAGRQEIQVAGHSTRESILGESDVEDLHLFPSMVFGKNGGILKIIVGFVMVVVGILLMAINPVLAFNLKTMGTMSIIGGLLQLLAPQPAGPAHKSQYLSNNQNTVAIGTPIPILYGERRVYGQILSLEVQAQNTI